MVYEKKTWVNVDDPSKFTSNELNSFPRFDADNMNRIENGIENALNQTPFDIGAVPALRRLDGVDILTVDSEGLYYCINTKNMPTTTTAGYLRVEYGAADYKVIYWRAYSSLKQYVNVLDGGKWTGWSEILTNKGGTIVGDLYLGDGYARVGGSKNATIINANDTQNNTNNGRKISLLNRIFQENLAYCLYLQDVVDGKNQDIKFIFGEHNRELMRIPYIQTRIYTGTGAGNDITLSFDFVPKIVFIEREVGSWRSCMAIMINGVTSISLFPVVGSSSSGVAKSTVTWNDKSVTFSTKDEDCYINDSGVAYYCVALG